jgi:hypothetical protein
MRRAQAWTLGAAVVVTLGAWGYLAWLGRIPLLWAIEERDALFGWALLELILAVAALVVVFARDRARTALRTGVTLLTAVIVVAMCEGMALLGLIHWDIELQHLFGEDAPMAWKFDPDPALGWKRVPNDRWVSPSISDVESGFHMRAARHKSLNFTYDAYGFRNPQTVPQADVVLIGDSYIEGGNADDSETLARRLEAQLGRPIESMGVAGYGTEANLINLDLNAPKLKPKVAVFFFFEGNDLYDDAEIESMWAASLDYTKKDLGMAAFEEFDKRSFLRNFLAYAMRWADPIVPNQAPYVGWIKDGPHKGQRILFADYAAVAWSPWIENRWNIAIEVMRKAAALNRRRGVKTIFVFLPIKERVYVPFVDLNKGAGMENWTFWRIRDQFKSFCEHEGDACLDLTEPFQRSLAEGGMPHLPTDSHWSPEGTDLVARELVPIIRRLLPAE